MSARREEKDFPDIRSTNIIGARSKMSDVATMVTEYGQKPGSGDLAVTVSASRQNCVIQTACCEAELVHNGHPTTPCCE
jgi:hypothetical protein